ncbi:GTPase IMAP family member 9-like [Cheilinus undulatus]|uniref:GTPase IMAP family member 9-like n=1 Tax=Cheilinus undulatus TaxID=241271 RepID=UPI001BD35D1D|nr:GTPase IMAP family member 9-like [Cheilinus undulatus]
MDGFAYNPDTAGNLYNPNRTPHYSLLLVTLYSLVILEIGGHGATATSFFYTGYDRTSDQELRIMMVGKTGTGKSATGNTILGRECFDSRFSAKSLTVVCSKGEGTVNGWKVAVIDTPGLFDTRFEMEKTEKDATQCITYAAPGPHVFLVVIRLGRYTEEEMKTVQRIQEIFGQAADRYIMVLFTHGDQLDGTTIEDFLDESPDLLGLLARCNWQYHVFNNKNKDRFQVTLLLRKIRSLVEENRGNHYTNEMFQKVQRALEEEKQRILEEKEEKERKEREELERKAKAQFEKDVIEINEQFQTERERERKEGEEQRKREKEEMEQERKTEREEREAQKKREREVWEEEMRRLKQQYTVDL